MTHDDLERVNDYATKYNVHYHAIDEERFYVQQKLSANTDS